MVFFKYYKIGKLHRAMSLLQKTMVVMLLPLSHEYRVLRRHPRNKINFIFDGVLRLTASNTPMI